MLSLGRKRAAFLLVRSVRNYLQQQQPGTVFKTTDSTAKGIPFKLSQEQAGYFTSCNVSTSNTLHAKSQCPPLLAQWRQYTRDAFSTQTLLGPHGPRLPNRVKTKLYQAQGKRFFSDQPKKLGNTLRAGQAAKAVENVRARAAAFDSLTGAGARYRNAIGLQFEAFWKRNSLALYGAVGLGVVLILWRLMFGVASLFVNLSERMANFGFFSLSVSCVILLGLYLRRRTTINPDSIYRLAMRQLNTFPAALEVMGAPLTGSEVRAYVMSGGGLRMSGFMPKFSTRRAYLIFPVRGSERRGLVSVEAKKKKGKYDFKLLAVDVPTAAGQEQRLFLIGDASAYKKAGGLVNELRDPIVKAMASQAEFEEEDAREEEEERRLEEEKLEREMRERAHKEQAEEEARRLEAEAKGAEEPAEQTKAA